MRLQLQGGSYVARSIIANAQRCVNYYPEANRSDSPTPYTYYQRGGLRQKVAAPQIAPVRGLWRASNGTGYAVIGLGVYKIAPNWTLTHLGDLLDPSEVPTSAVDNGTDILLVDGSSHGYTINLASDAFAVVVDPTGTFNGATRVDYIDTFILWNIIGTREFGSTLSGSITFDALYFAGKVGWADPLQTLYINRHEIILLGQLKSEIWYDAGNAGFPFAELPGAYIEHGTCAPYSLASNDVETFWLHQDLQGQGMVISLKGYDVRRVSNHALEFALQNIAKRATLTDAIGWSWQQGGHSFYTLTFPSGDETWVFDLSLESDPTMAWHQEAWTDPTGPGYNLKRHRARCGANIYGLNVVGDWATGVIYSVDPDLYTDHVGGGIGPISWIKGYPHVRSTVDPQTGQLSDANDLTITHNNFSLDIETGMVPLNDDGTAAELVLAYSDDKGKTFSQTPLQSFGKPGEYLTDVDWGRLGVARDRVYELRHSASGPAALNGGWVDVVRNSK